MSNNARQCPGIDFTHFDLLVRLGFQEMNSSFLHLSEALDSSTGDHLVSQFHPSVFHLVCPVLAHVNDSQNILFLNKVEMCSVTEKQT